MAASLRRLSPAAALPPAVRQGRRVARGLVLALFALPLLAALPWAVIEGLSAEAWRSLLDDPQLPRALASSVFTAVASTVISLALTLLIVTRLHGTRAWMRAAGVLGPMLAVPHAAFAIGLAWLIAPAGWIARALAPAFGWTAPPPWETVNDPRGLALLAVLVLKETPFLLWSALALLSRPEVAGVLQRQLAVARTLGYTPAAWWWRVGWLAWAPRLAWPVLAVGAYGLTVVDLAIIVGPGAPPTLAALAWQWLADADRERNAQGAAAALLLSGVLALAVGLALLACRIVAAWARRRVTSGVRPPAGGSSPRWASALGLGFVALYGAVLVGLVVLSLAGPWAFPSLWPAAPSADVWQQAFTSLPTIGFTAALAMATSVLSLLLAVAWLESTPPYWDRWATPWVLLPLVLPQLLLLVGLYRGALALHLDGQVAGLLWVHVLMALPYVFTALAPAWRSFDVRYEWTALALGRTRRAFWWRVKWPLLAAPIASALAIGFAVSVAQYLSTQFIGTGRHPTLTTEAVTLASGGQRALAAAFALLQALLPALGFALAAAVGRRAGASLSSAR